jgi:hypothetical protein
MNPFPSTAYWNAVRGRTVEPVPLLEVTLVDGATGYMSDRRVDLTGIGGHLYLPRLVKWGPISSNITGSSSTATFTLSNVDRTLELAARDHMFQRGVVVFKVYMPDVVTGGGSLADATRIEWIGFIDKTPYDQQTFSLSCKDGLFDLTLPLPRRRFSRNCDLQFDDGLYCPYSGFGYTGAGAGPRVAIPEILGVLGEASVPDDFGPDISSTEGYKGRPYLTTCDKTFGPSSWFHSVVYQAGSQVYQNGGIWQASVTNNEHQPDSSPTYWSYVGPATGCLGRGMARFYGGQRYVCSWATGYLGGNFLTRFLGGGDPYTSYSSQTSTIFDQAVPLVYAGAATGFTCTPLILEWRPESDYVSVECIVGEGVLGNAPAASGDVNIGAIQDVQVNSLLPTNGEFPAPAWPAPGCDKGVGRSPGRIGEPHVWTQIEGDMLQTDSPGDPQVYISSRAGFFARVKDTSSGVNSPDASKSTGASSAPSVYANLAAGRRVWQYGSTTSRVYGVGGIYGGSGNPVWIILDMVLEAFNIKYTSIATHATFIDLQSFIDFATYAADNITGLDGSTVQRYQFAGQFSELAPAMDQIDSALRDCHGFRFFRNGKLAVRQFSACQDATVRPAFQEFVNVKHNSLKPDIPTPSYNELDLNFADHDFDFQQNMATVYSIDYQKLIGLNGYPFKMAQSYNLVGTCFTEQAARLGLRMLRHELGGTSPQLWAQVRNVELDSTLLMDELEVGDITYLAHTLMPNGGDWIRIEEKALNDDWGMTFKVRSWRSSEYDDILSGDPFVELARFPRNVYIRGSKGFVYPPLPALLWAAQNPCVSLPSVGVRLSWQAYSDLSKQKLLQAVQIFRTPDNNLAAGGFLLADVDASATAWTVDNTWDDFDVTGIGTRSVYQVGSEQVLATNCVWHGDGTATLTVTRGYNSTNAEPHLKYDQIASISLLDQLPHPSQLQALVSATQYMDPWEETTTTSTTTSSTTT